MKDPLAFWMAVVSIGLALITFGMNLHTAGWQAGFDRCVEIHKEARERP